MMVEKNWKELAEKFRSLRNRGRSEPPVERKRRPRPLRQDGRSIREWQEGEAREDARQSRIRVLTRLYKTHLEKRIPRVRLITTESEQWKYFENLETIFTATGFSVDKWDLYMEAQFAMMPVVSKSKKSDKSFRKYPAPCNLDKVKAFQRFNDYVKSLEKRYPDRRIPSPLKKEEEFTGELRNGFYNGYEFLINLMRVEKLTPPFLFKIFEAGTPCFTVAFILTHPLILPSALAGDFSVFKSTQFRERMKRDFRDVLLGRKELLQRIANLRNGVKEEVKKILIQRLGEVNDNVYGLL